MLFLVDICLKNAHVRFWGFLQHMPQTSYALLLLQGSTWPAKLYRQRNHMQAADSTKMQLPLVLQQLKLNTSKEHLY